jgi:phosphoribosylglycinamide formyltransferase-1
MLPDTTAASSQPGLATSSIRLAVLASGRGSNLEALFLAQDAGRLTAARIVLVISNRAQAPALALAKARSVATRYVQPSQFASLEAYDAKLLEACQEAGIDAIALAGYTRRLSSVFIAAYPGRILNMHPSLLPRHGGPGMLGPKVHQSVLAAGDVESGCTVHLVTEGLDEGPILSQRRVAVLPGDTPETLAARVLMEEHQLYADTLEQWVRTQFFR